MNHGLLDGRSVRGERQYIAPQLETSTAVALRFAQKGQLPEWVGTVREDFEGSDKMTLGLVQIARLKAESGEAVLGLHEIWFQLQGFSIPCFCVSRAAVPFQGVRKAQREIGVSRKSPQTALGDNGCLVPAFDKNVRRGKGDPEIPFSGPNPGGSIEEPKAFVGFSLRNEKKREHSSGPGVIRVKL